MMSRTRRFVALGIGVAALGGAGIALAQRSGNSASSVHSPSSGAAQDRAAEASSIPAVSEPDPGHSSSVLSSHASEALRPDYPSKVASAVVALEGVRAQQADSNEQARAERRAILASPAVDLRVVVADEEAKYRPKVLPGVVLRARIDSFPWRKVRARESLGLDPQGGNPLLEAVNSRGLAGRGEWRRLSGSVVIIGGEESVRCSIGSVVHTRLIGGGSEATDVRLELSLMNGSEVRALKQGFFAAPGLLYMDRRDAGGQSAVLRDDKGATYTVKCSPGTLEVFGPDGQVITTIHAVARGLPTPEEMGRAGLPPIPGAQLSQAQSAIRSQYPDPTSAPPSSTAR